MIIKQRSDHFVKEAPFCGKIREILVGSEYSPNIAVATKMRETTAHYHQGFDEISFLMSGSISLRLYDPDADRTTEVKLRANELCVISKGIHHKVTEWSENNRLCVISVPYFEATDEHLSHKI